MAFSPNVERKKQGFTERPREQVVEAFRPREGGKLEEQEFKWAREGEGLAVSLSAMVEKQGSRPWVRKWSWSPRRGAAGGL